MITKVTMMMYMMVLCVHDVKKKSCKSTLQGEWVGFSKRAMESELWKIPKQNSYETESKFIFFTCICIFDKRGDGISTFENSKKRLDICHQDLQVGALKFSEYVST